MLTKNFNGLPKAALFFCATFQFFKLIEAAKTFINIHQEIILSKIPSYFLFIIFIFSSVKITHEFFFFQNIKMNADNG